MEIGTVASPPPQPPTWCQTWGTGMRFGTVLYLRLTGDFHPLQAYAMLTQKHPNDRWVCFRIFHLHNKHGRAGERIMFSPQVVEWTVRVVMGVESPAL